MTIKISPANPPKPSDPDEIADAVKILMDHGFEQLLLYFDNGTVLMRKPPPPEKKCGCGVDNNPSCN